MWDSSKNSSPYENWTQADWNNWMPFEESPFDQLWFKVLLTICYGIVFAACVLGNLLVLVVILYHRKMRNVINFFLANLAGADLCVGIFCVLPNLSLYMSQYWLIGKIMCKLFYFVKSLNYSCSVIILTVISIERYIAIINPILNRRFIGNCAIRAGIAVCVWLVSIGYSIPLLFVYDTVSVQSDPNDPAAYDVYCVMILHSSVIPTAYVMVDFLVFYILPLALMTFVYFKIAMALWHSSVIEQDRVFRSVRASTSTACDRCNRTRHRETTTRLGSLQMTAGGFRGSGAETTEQHTGGCNAQRASMTRSHRASCTTKASVNDNHWTSSATGRGGETIEDAPPEDRNSNRNSRNICVRCGSNAFRTESTISTTAGRSCMMNTSWRACRGRNPLIARRKVIRLLIAMVIAFAVCMFPHHVRLQWQEWSNSKHISIELMYLPPFTTLLFYVNSGLNPILYSLISDKFKKLQWWRCLIRRRYRGKPANSSTSYDASRPVLNRHLNQGTP